MCGLPGRQAGKHLGPRNSKTCPPRPTLSCMLRALCCAALQVMASKDKIYVVMELVTGGELFDQIVAEGPKKVGGDWVWEGKGWVEGQVA